MPLLPEVPGDFPYETPWASPPTTGGAGDGWRSPSGTGRGHAIWGMTARLTQDIARHLE